VGTLESADTNSSRKEITLVSVDKSTTSTRPGDSFVDDTTTGTTDDNVTKDLSIEKTELTSEEEAMVKIMEDIIQFFLDLLQVYDCSLMDERRANSTGKQNYTLRYYNDMESNMNDINSQEKGIFTRA
jgi:hypothetical protein